MAAPAIARAGGKPALRERVRRDRTSRARVYRRVRRFGPGFRGGSGARSAARPSVDTDVGATPSAHSSGGALAPPDVASYLMGSVPNMAAPAIARAGGKPALRERVRRDRTSRARVYRRVRRFGPGFRGGSGARSAARPSVDTDVGATPSAHSSGGALAPPDVASYLMGSVPNMAAPAIARAGGKPALRERVRRDRTSRARVYRRVRRFGPGFRGGSGARSAARPSVDTDVGATPSAHSSGGALAPPDVASYL